jgi:predicted lipid carrier protein YhbT
MRRFIFSAIKKTSQPFLNFAGKTFVATHKNFFNDLGEYRFYNFLIKINDLPFAILISPNQENFQVTICDKKTHTAAISTVSAKLKYLLKLAQCNSDADALFFSRHIKIEGNVAAAMALRNAIERGKFTSSLAIPFLVILGRKAEDLRSLAAEFKLMRSSALRAKDDEVGELRMTRLG